MPGPSHSTSLLLNLHFPHPLSSVPKASYPNGISYNSYIPPARKPAFCAPGIFSPAQVSPTSSIPESGPETYSPLPSPSQPQPLTPKLTTTKSSHNKIPPSSKHSSHHAALNSLQSTETPYPEVPSSHPFHQPPTSTLPLHPQLHDHRPPSNRLGISHTELRTHEFVNCIRAFNPNFSFHHLLQSLSIMLLQFRLHPNPSALRVIFNSFLTTLLGLPLNG
jgi:hypothetical protein